MENYNAQPMSIKDWFITVLITAIPIVGFIMLFVWGFGGNVNLNKQNWAKATLLMIVVVFALYLVMLMTVGAAFMFS